MELAIRVQVEELPEGVYLATSEELPGLVAQGRTVSEAPEIARDVARKLIDARRERGGDVNVPSTQDRMTPQSSRVLGLSRVSIRGPRGKAHRALEV